MGSFQRGWVGVICACICACASACTSGAAHHAEHDPARPSDAGAKIASDAATVDRHDGAVRDAAARDGAVRDAAADGSSVPVDDDDASARDGAVVVDTDAMPADAGAPPIKIGSIVVAQAYHDFPILPVKQWCKFEVFFTADIDRLKPEQVKSIHVDGPNGYTFDFANAEFSLLSPNGYIINGPEHFFWYQAILPGFLDDGVYKITATLTDGTSSSYSRELRSNFALLDFYLNHASEMKYTPNGGTSPADDTVLHWSTLKELGGPDAYYNVWISPGTGFVIDAASARGDTIFADAFTNPKAGFNSNHSRKGSKADPLPLGSQVWQPEIVDANVLEKINMIIFPAGTNFEAVADAPDASTMP